MLQSRVLIPITKKLFWLAKYIVLHPLKAFFFVIKVYLSLLLLVFCLTSTFSAFANIEITEGFDIEGHLFHLSNSKVQKTETTTLAFDTGGPYAPLLQQYCQGKSQTNRYPLRNCSGGYTNEQRLNSSTVTAECQCSSVTSPGGDSSSVLLSVSVSVYDSLVSSCPPDDDATYTTTVTQGQTSVCFDPLDLTSRDSCPKSSSSPDYMLPSDGSGSARVCNKTANGSICAYDLSSDGEAYIPNFEANCYDGDIPSFDSSAFSETADNDPQTTCEDIGNGVMACAEDPSNVCDGFSCQQGCGFFGLGDQTEFICLSGDMDGDNVADYADPDIDGDGIPNNQDLDSDGDGQDDPFYANTNTGTTVNVTFDDSGIISSIQAQTNTLAASLNDIENNFGPGGEIDFSVPQHIRDLTTPNDYNVRNYGTVIQGAVDEMKTSSLFTALDGFFDVSFVGQCPVYSAYIDYIMTNIVIDHFCGPVMNAIWPIIQAVVMVVFSLLAFRVAFL